MTQPPNIRFRGLRSPKTPGGYILGRMPGVAAGEVQLLNLQQLRRFGLIPASDAKQALAQHGFGFFMGGLGTAGALIGRCSFPYDLAFATDEALNSVTAKVAPTGNPSFTMVADNASGIPTVYGQINFTANSTRGEAVWSPDPFLLTKGSILSVYAPSPADATLADVTATVAGISS